jgi:SAM-dependent methyltransferase
MPCPICSNSDVEVFARARDEEYFTSDQLYTYLRCPKCTAVFLDAPPTDRLREIYPPNYYSYTEHDEGLPLTERAKEWLNGRMLRSLLSQIPGERLRVLDVGGGSGWSLTQARRVCPRVAETHEVDMDPAARALAERAGHVYHQTPVEHFESDLQFDLIIMLSVIEHVPDPGRVLAKMRDRLSPEGVLLIKTPNTDTLDCRIFRRRYWAGLHCPRHFVLFTKQGLTDLAQRHGLRVRTCRYTQGAPQWALSVMASMHSRGWLDANADQPTYEHRLYGPLCALFAAVDFARAPLMPTAQMIVTLRRAA